MEVAMERRREIAAAPIRTAVEAWQTVVQLLAATLERSPDVPEGSVAQALTPLAGLGPALVAGGHLESKGLVLVDIGLHLTIVVLTGDAALDVEDNLNPVPGGASATTGWTLHIPAVGALDKVLSAAVKDSPHLSTKEAPASAPKRAPTSIAESPVDLDALRSLGNKS
jgi:hypothetical protein